MERVTLIKRNTSAEIKMTARVSEQDEGMSFSFSQAHVQNGGWRLRTDTHLVHAASKYLQEQPVLKL